MQKILIIEDNSEIQNILTDLLNADYQVVSAFSGTEGLLVFSEQEISLVLLDIMLPGKTGDQVLQEIRQTSQIPVIIMTALSEKKRISEYLLAGANDYITKPFDLDELAARVKVQLRGNSAPVSKSLSFKNIHLDLEAYSISTGEQQVQLSATEFEILSTLMKNPKQIFTKERLYESVWHEMYLPGDNTLNTHLSNLRKKIASLDAENDYIETIWGLGVRMAK